jgi:hypothetical protein
LDKLKLKENNYLKYFGFALATIFIFISRELSNGLNLLKTGVLKHMMIKLF